MIKESREKVEISWTARWEVERWYDQGVYILVISQIVSAKLLSLAVKLLFQIISSFSLL